MFRYCSILIVQATMLLAPAAVIAAPAQLYGKSIIVSWTENRVQRNVGEEQFRSVAIHHEMSTYVSGAGRVFNKLQNSNGRRSAANEQVAGQETGSRSPRISSFSGHSMIVMQTQQGMARRVAVEFDESFTTCTASVIRGKQSGVESGFSTSMITGKRHEIKSATVNGVSCTVRTGNVFE